MNASDSTRNGIRQDIQIRWSPRHVPLVPTAALAAGAGAVHLARRLAEGPAEELAHLEGVVSGDLLLLLGGPDRLPWVDGIVYLGCDPEAQRLLMPTTHAPSVHPLLVERALVARFPQAAVPLAIIPWLGIVLPAGGAMPIDRARLAAWAAGVRLEARVGERAARIGSTTSEDPIR